jgi:hypothetical protein
MHNDDISKLLNKIPEFQEKKTKVLTHFELVKKVTSIMGD